MASDIYIPSWKSLKTFAVSSKPTSSLDDVLFVDWSQFFTNADINIKSWDHCSILLSVYTKLKSLQTHFPSSVGEGVAELENSSDFVDVLLQQLQQLCNSGIQKCPASWGEDVQRLCGFLMSAKIKSKTKCLIENVVHEMSNHFSYKVSLNVEESINDHKEETFRQCSMFDFGLKEPSTDLLTARFDNLSRYLEWHFRSLAKDFLEPLQLGVEKFRTSSDVNYYGEVSLVSYTNVNGYLNLKLKFFSADTKFLKESSKRLLPGSLVCLLCNDIFDFALLTENSTSLLDDGMILVSVTNINSFKLFGKTRFHLVESRVYFEAYRHVLEVIQKRRQIPFTQSIVNNDITVKPPLFVPNDLDMILNSIAKNSKTEVSRAEFKDYLRSMRNSQAIELNDCQLEAVSSLLDNNQILIQGPPGSGKSFIGKKIVSLLLENRDRLYKEGPILIVCFTNRALDSFLENLTPITSNIVRIGTRTSSDIVDRFSLLSIKQDSAIKRSSHIYRAKGKLRAELEALNAQFDDKLSKVSVLKDGVTKTKQFWEEVIHLSNAIRSRQDKMDEMNVLSSVIVASKADVVGCTTTGAAKNHALIENIGAKVVVFEEAGQILEAHTIASLPTTCEQLIMIGDHQQLRPKVATNRLEKTLKLNISLFERLILNGRPFVTMCEQHRMRPEISAIIKEVFYPNLTDGFSVKGFPNIRGTSKNVAFVTHQFQEAIDFEGGMSKTNVFEAEYVLELASYLIKMGYKQTDITILTTYVGQWGVIAKLINSEFPGLAEVRVAVVDNFQGEESNIVLLSTVRSGDSIGFLSESGRVCVALTRAKMGMFIIGNMHVLSKKSKLWRSIEMSMLSKEMISSTLTLQCPRHSSSLLSLGSPKEFRQQFCKEICNESLNCGHNCRFKCHSWKDANHKEEFACKERCLKTCPEGHKCEKSCSDPCHPCAFSEEKTLPCEHKVTILCASLHVPALCKTPVVEILDCGHEVEKYCHEKEKKCSKKCEFLLNCGHPCNLSCHQSQKTPHNKMCLYPCSRLNQGCRSNHKCELPCWKPCPRCLEKVGVQLPCGHKNYEIVCSDDPGTFDCTEKCEKRLTCGHLCKMYCYECREGCPPCPLVSKHRFPCGHEKTLKCAEIGDGVICSEKCDQTLPCGHPCPKQCGETCGGCNVLVSSSEQVGSCGHKALVPCSLTSSAVSSRVEISKSTKCVSPCNQPMACGHVCSAICQDCLNGKLHVPCRQPCQRQLVCGHFCDGQCGELCPPCNKKCLISCQHQSCKAKCDDDACTTCKEKCQRKCDHVQCKKRCSSKDSHSFCRESCPRQLACGHECLGYCGEECPETCPVCCNEISTENERFVLLNCGHSVLERSVLTPMEEKYAQVLVCPICKAVISRIHRFIDRQKLCKRYVSNVNMKFFAQISKTQRNIEDILSRIDEDVPSGTLHDAVKAKLSNKKKPVTFQDLIVVKVKICIIKHLSSKTTDEDSLQKSLLARDSFGVQYVRDLLTFLDDPIVAKTVNDLLSCYSMNSWFMCDKCNDVHGCALSKNPCD